MPLHLDYFYGRVIYLCHFFDSHYSFACYNRNMQHIALHGLNISVLFFKS